LLKLFSVIKKTKLDQVKYSKGKTDWKYVKSNNAEVVDIKAPTLTDVELAQIKNVEQSRQFDSLTLRFSRQIMAALLTGVE